jgi:hypothetical protein
MPEIRGINCSKSLCQWSVVSGQLSAAISWSNHNGQLTTDN